jgi:polysaccharide deacetylase family protein (PEP-CTERM system associated)
MTGVRPGGILSVDVEDYFQVEAFSDRVCRDEWPNYPHRVEANTLRVLDLLDECSVKGTFFILGWIAEHYPAIVREIAARGHELAVHSYWHRLIYKLSPQEFREDTRIAKDAVEQASGQAVYGYRAPSYSVTRKSLWALEVLAECGFRYDSSIFSVRHDLYGIHDAPRTPFRVSTPSGTLKEFPITTFRLGWGPNWPVAGGGYLRIFPFLYTRLGVGRALREGVPVITYFHPWELDPEQPRMAGRALSRFRHYTNLSRTAGRIRQLCGLIDYMPFEAALRNPAWSEVPEWRP